MILFSSRSGFLMYNSLLTLWAIVKISSQLTRYVSPYPKHQQSYKHWFIWKKKKVYGFYGTLLDKLYNGCWKGPEENIALLENYFGPPTLQWLVFQANTYVALSAELFIWNNIILGSPKQMHVVAYSLCPLNGCIYVMATCAISKDRSPIRKKVKYVASTLHT